ncbi:DUF281 domain-containing protein [Caenorhabditis elegans]|uniref:DUF281 domain-containing protein n=1 Tax=Caenorhabditis elegans TaxID=6239 RepID=O17290_CAEEL|nr:DUF281 domain-containing protein [Caenorhabditis elegans]CCD67115.1 DUF281 domain-containing protein [Caenorhabditis elegans]|eukprot:NP_494184.1 Uncharacterized protein CELE_R52.5 [Caenorhabditis elegans]
MNTLCPIILCFVITVTECCMKTIPPDDVSISSTLPYEETTEMMTTIAMETSTMTEKVCPGDTTCPDLLAYGGGMEFGEIDGCTVPVCSDGKVAWMIFRNVDFEMKLYDGLSDLSLVLPVPPPTLAGMGGKSFVDYYGLLCEDNSWKITKYPLGIKDYGNTQAILGADGSYDGKKGLLETIQCH